MKPYDKMTPRERLIDGAVGYMWKVNAERTLSAAHECIEGFIPWDAKDGTYGAEMRAYYQACTQKALERLVHAVLKEYTRKRGLL